MQLLINLAFSIIAVIFIAIPRRGVSRHVGSLIISTLWVGLIYYSTLDGQYLISHGIRAQATVSKVECSGGSGTFITFMFQNRSGNTTQARKWLKGVRCDYYSVGSPVQIVYAPNDPTLNFVGLPEKNSIGALLFLFILVYAMMAIGNRYESNRKLNNTRKEK